MIDAHRIIRTHDLATHKWHDYAPHHPEEPQEHPHHADDPMKGLLDAEADLFAAILSQHRANFDLWHQEDLARDMSATAENIATVKHAIDRLNQSRNDLVEKIDETLLNAVPCQNCDSPLTPSRPALSSTGSRFSP